MKSAIQLKAQLLRVIATVEFARAISSSGPIDQQGAVNEEIISNSGKILLIAEEVEFKSSQILKHRNVEAYGRLVAINSLSLVVQSISRRTAVAETAYLQNIKERKRIDRKRKKDRKKKR